MSNDHSLPNVDHASDDIDHNRRDLAQSAALLLLTASLGVGVGCSRSSDAMSGSGTDAAAARTPSLWGDPAALVSAIGAGTLAVASVAESVEAYSNAFGYVEHWRGQIPSEMAEIWGAPAMAGRNAAVAGPPGYQRGMIRFVELGKDFQPTPYHETLGWVALEIQVRSPDDLVAYLEGSPNFVHTGGPRTFKDRDGTSVYRAAQFTGPSGEPLYMTSHMQLDKLSPVRGNNVGPLFIQTLAAYPYQSTLDFYLSTLGLKMRMELDSPRTSLVKELGLPQDRTYKMAAVRAPEYCSLQIDEYPEATPQRSFAPGCFPSGVSMSTLTTRNLNAVKDALLEASIDVTDIGSNPIPPYVGARGVFYLGNSGERVEIVEVTNL